MFLAWQVPFFVLAVPTIVCIAFALRLKEPIRGAHERRQAGADDATAAIEDEPPRLAEAFRILASGRSTRRIWSSLPFLAASIGGIQLILVNFYEEEYGLGTASRAPHRRRGEAFQIVGLIAAAVVVSG